MKNIIITGGELFNKGAQAMTFVAVSELKKRFPNHEIYLLSEMDRRRPEEEKRQYAFKFTGWYPVKFARAQKDPMLRLTCLLRSGHELRECEALYRNCDLMVDISGYGVGSNWGINQLTNYIDHLEFAQKFDIPMYLMPQSFGPFDFQGEKKAQGDRLPDLLSNIKWICAREQEGAQELRDHYQLENVCVGPDLVLNNKGIDLSRVFRQLPEIKVPEILPNSVGIIPNGKTVELRGMEFVLDLYRKIITELRLQGKHVYILAHATGDQKLCRQIMESNSNEESVIYLDREFSCLEYNELVKHFDFLIASRFHSIIHAFKNGVPCITLGWAVKYNDLMEEFGQSRYGFDLRNQVDDASIITAIALLAERHAIESKQILEHLTAVQQNNIFDIFNH